MPSPIDPRFQEILNKDAAEREAAIQAIRQAERDYIVEQLIARADAGGGEALRSFAHELAVDTSSDALVRRYSIYLHFFTARASMLSRDTSSAMDPQTMPEHAAAALGVTDANRNQPRITQAGMAPVDPTQPKTIGEFRDALTPMLRL